MRAEFAAGSHGNARTIGEEKTAMLAMIEHDTSSIL